MDFLLKAHNNTFKDQDHSIFWSGDNLSLRHFLRFWALLSKIKTPSALLIFSTSFFDQDRDALFNFNRDYAF